MKNLKNGDIQAFNELFGYYGRRLYHFSYRYLRSEPECEELVQEVFTRVWDKRSELKEDLSVKEIASDMKISKKTVENQLTEALKFIRSLLTDERMAGILFLCLFIL